MKTLKFVQEVFFLGLFAAGWVANIQAAPVIYQATGTREQVQIVVDQFKRDIIYGPGNDEQHPPSILSFLKTVTFDDVGVGSDTLVTSIGSYVSGGISLGTLPGSRFLTSAGTTDPNNPNRLFGDIHPSYTIEFAPFSPPSIFAIQDPMGGPTSQLLLYGGPYLTGGKAFGAVFVDVDSTESAWINSFYSEREDPLSFKPLRLPVPAAPGQGNFSFIGFLLNEGEGLSWGDTTITLPGLTLQGEAATGDMVAIDEIMYGIVPEPNSLLLLIVGGLLSWTASRWRGKPLPGVLEPGRTRDCASF